MYTLSSLSPRKKAFLFSTLLLTASGFICRVLGFLPDFPVPHHRSRRTWYLSYGSPCFRHLFFSLRRFHPDCPLPAHCLAHSRWQTHLSSWYRSVYGDVPDSVCSDLQILRFSRPLCPDGTGMRPISSCHGDFCSFCRLPRLHQRLLLRRPEIQGSCLFSNCRTSDPHDPCFFPGQLYDCCRKRNHR